MGDISTGQLLDLGDELREDKVIVMGKQKTNREMLRGLEEGGFLSAPEKKRLAEMYPVRERNAGEDE